MQNWQLHQTLLWWVHLIAVYSFTWELATERADGYRQGGIGRRPCKMFWYKACLTSYHQQRHLDLWYFVRSLFLFPAPLSAQTQCAEKTAEGLERRVWSVWSVSTFYIYICIFRFFFFCQGSHIHFLKCFSTAAGIEERESLIPRAGACSKHLKLQNSLHRDWELASLGKAPSVSLWDQLEL